VSGNHADRGGGIFNAFGLLALDHSTDCDNSAVLGADLFNWGGTVTLDHSTVCQRADV
jgi:hypothetical protein